MATVQFQPHRQRPEPVNGVGQVLISELENCLTVLANVFDVSFAKKHISSLDVFRVKRQSVEFGVAHDGEGVSTLDHRSHDFQHFLNLRSSVNKVAQEYHFAFSVTVSVHKVREDLPRCIAVAFDMFATASPAICLNVGSWINAEILS